MIAPPEATAESLMLTMPVPSLPVAEAAVKSWLLKGYRDNADKPLELIDPAAANLGLPFTIEIKDQKRHDPAQ